MGVRSLRPSASRSGAGRWRFRASAAGSSGSTSGGPLGEVGNVLAEGVGIQGEHGLVALRGLGGRQLVGGGLANGSGIQGEHGPMALRGIGGRQLERRRPARQRPGRESPRVTTLWALLNATLCSLPQCRSRPGLLTDFDLLRVRYPFWPQPPNNA